MFCDFDKGFWALPLRQFSYTNISVGRGKVTVFMGAPFYQDNCDMTLCDKLGIRQLFNSKL